MALQVWLPLIGSLENKGLSGTKPENSGAVVDSSGKLGSCYSFGGSNFIDTKFVENFGTGDFTVSAWIYIIQTAGKTYQCIVGNKARAANSAGFSIYWNQNQKKFMWSTADGSATTEIWTSETFDSVVYNSWHHIAMVRNSSDPKKGYFYFDGIRKEIASVPAIRNVSTSTTVKIGSITPVDAAYYFTGKINDVRIYDHALSAREVQEIAKGLMLHYPLSDTVAPTNGKIYDCSGYGHHGNYSATPPTVQSGSSRRSRSLFYKNVDNYFSSSIVMPADNKTISLSYWFKSANAGTGSYHEPFNIGVNGLELGVNNTSNGRPRFGMMLDGVRQLIDTGSGVQDGNWHHIAHTYDGSTMCTYIDGTLRGSKAASGSLISGSRIIWSGRYGNSTAYGNANTSLSDIRVYSTALSADQVKELYDNPVSVCKSGNLMCMEVVE